VAWLREWKVLLPGVSTPALAMITTTEVSTV
jgi:hypothetical protein